MFEGSTYDIKPSASGQSSYIIREEGKSILQVTKRTLSLSPTVEFSDPQTGCVRFRAIRDRLSTRYRFENAQYEGELWSVIAPRIPGVGGRWAIANPEGRLTAVLRPESLLKRLKSSAKYAFETIDGFCCADVCRRGWVAPELSVTVETDNLPSIVSPRLAVLSTALLGTTLPFA